ncbi:hypothetical protein [Pseudonocardia sp. DLS-67]
MERGTDYPWYPLPEDATVQLIAIERRAVRRQPNGLPIEPARVVWGVLIDEGGTTHERHDLGSDVMRALHEDGGERIYPMTRISPLRLNAAIERATGGPEAGEKYTLDPTA